MHHTSPALYRTADLVGEDSHDLVGARLATAIDERKWRGPPTKQVEAVDVCGYIMILIDYEESDTL